MRDLVIHCKPGIAGRGSAEYSIRERGRSTTVAGPFSDAASASIAGRSFAQEHGVELWLEDRDDRGRAMPARRLWPPLDSGVFKVEKRPHRAR